MDYRLRVQLANGSSALLFNLPIELNYHITRINWNNSHHFSVPVFFFTKWSTQQQQPIKYVTTNVP